MSFKEVFDLSSYNNSDMTTFSGDEEAEVQRRIGFARE